MPSNRRRGRLSVAIIYFTGPDVRLDRGHQKTIRVWRMRLVVLLALALEPVAPLRADPLAPRQIRLTLSADPGKLVAVWVSFELAPEASILQFGPEFQQSVNGSFTTYLDDLCK